MRPLAWGWAYGQDKDALAAAENLLKVFFLDEETRMMPETLYAQVNLEQNPLKGDKLFVVAVSHRGMRVSAILGSIGQGRSGTVHGLDARLVD